MRADLKRLLDKFGPGDVAKQRIEVASNLWIEFRAAEMSQDRFSLGSFDYLEDGGWVMEELTKAINHCLAEKWTKTVHLRQRYASWWLVLVDYIHHLLLSSTEASRLSEALPNLKQWDRVVLIDPQSPERSLTLHE